MLIVKKKMFQNNFVIVCRIKKNNNNFLQSRENRELRWKFTIMHTYYYVLNLYLEL